MDSDLQHLAGLLRRDSETPGIKRTFVLHLGPKLPARVKDRSQDQIVTQRIAPIRFDV